MAKTHRHNTIQTETQQTQDAALRPNGLGGGSSRLLPGRSEPSTRHGETTERPADVPSGDGDSDRDVAQPRSGWLSGRGTLGILLFIAGRGRKAYWNRGVGGEGEGAEPIQ